MLQLKSDKQTKPFQSIPNVVLLIRLRKYRSNYSNNNDTEIRLLEIDGSMTTAVPERDYAVATAKFEVNACANTDFAFVMKFALITLIHIFTPTPILPCKYSGFLCNLNK